MDPPAATEVAVPQQRRRRRGIRYVDWTLHFTITFVILSLLKLEPLARNSVQDHNNEIDMPHNRDIDTPQLLLQSIETGATNTKQSQSSFDVHLQNEDKKSANMFEWKCWDKCSCLPAAQLITEGKVNSTNAKVTIMHQSYKSSDPHTWHWGWKSQRQTWIDLHPDWLFIFWDDEQNALLAKCTGYDDVLEGRSGIQSADLSRLLYLNEYGGLYTDMDYIALQNHEHVFNLDKNQVNLQQILLQGRQDQVIGFEWGYARNQQHPLWAFCLNIARRQKGPSKRKGCPIWYTGPKFLNRCVKKYFKQQNKELEHMVSYGQNDLMILEPNLIAPVRGDDFTSECGKWRNHEGQNESKWTTEWPESSCIQYLNGIGAFAVTLYSHSWGEGLKC